MEAFKNYKKQKGEKSLEKSKEGLEKELTITNQLYGKAHMDVSIDGLYTSKLFNAKIDAEDLINANNYSIKDLNKLKDNLQKVNNSIRKKYPLLLPSKKELEIIKKDNEELLKRMRSILSKEKLFLTEDKKTTLERFVDTMV
ncbi:hypothetical protein KKG31_01745 [Patescibacteria group bacterium]|nr:hypothetical protein [Patescibacteria group bacterium]